MPEWLTPEAQRHWTEVVPWLVESGVATSADAPALAMMCEWWSEWMAFRSGERGGTSTSRVNALATCSKQWHGVASKFGLTPSDRAKITGNIETADDLSKEFGFG